MSSAHLGGQRQHFASSRVSTEQGEDVQAEGPQPESRLLPGRRQSWDGPRETERQRKGERCREAQSCTTWCGVTARRSPRSPDRLTGGFPGWRRRNAGGWGQSARSVRSHLPRQLSGYAGMPCVCPKVRHIVTDRERAPGLRLDSVPAQCEASVRPAASALPVERQDACGQRGTPRGRSPGSPG